MPALPPPGSLPRHLSQLAHHTSRDSQSTFASTSCRDGLRVGEALADTQVPESCSIQYRMITAHLEADLKETQLSAEGMLAQLVYERSDLGTLHSEIPTVLEPTKLRFESLPRHRYGPTFISLSCVLLVYMRER